jgi:hypothetical protein
MNDEQIRELAETIAAAIAKAVNESKIEKTEQPSALSKSEKDQFEQGRLAMRRFQKRGGAA